MKNIFLTSLLISVVLLISCSSPNGESSKKYDTRAIKSLDRLTEAIGKLESCSYTLNTMVFKNNETAHAFEHDAYMRGPDKMHLHSNGKKGRRSYWYNGKEMSYYSFEKNTFDTFDAPNNIVETIDLVNKEYGIDFPAGDFFFPTLADDIITHYNHVLLLEDEVIDGVNCVGILASKEKESVHIWIEKITNLPVKMVLENSSASINYYEAAFSNWKLNPVLPDELFEFSPPENALKSKLQANL